MKSPAEDLPRLPQFGPDRRKDSKVRRQLSAPAMRTFFHIVEGGWNLSSEQQRGLLGWPSPSTFFNYKAGKVGALSLDMLTRISLVLGIYKNLQILYPEEALADSWVKLPNNNRLFGGKPAITYMTENDMDALFQVRRLLDARRGAWS